MTTTAVRQARLRATEPSVGGGERIRIALLACGILASLLYAAMLGFVPLGWDGYSSASQTVSELSAINAPTRSLWVSLGLVWTALYAAFGWGIWRSAGGNRRLRVVGAVLIVSAGFGVFWPPMHQREVLAAGGATLTDTLHIVWTMVNGALTLLAMAFGAAAFGARFRLYSIATMMVLLGAGAVTGTYTSRIQINLPTPGVGIWERINIGVWLLWIAVLAFALLRRRPDAANATRVRVGAATPASGESMAREPNQPGRMGRAATITSVIRAFARRRPALSYYALVFAISWGGILALVGESGIPGQPDEVERLFPFALAVLFAGPSIAGVVMTALVSGRAGLRELLGAFVRWRVGAWWWAAALLTGPVLVTAVLFGLSLSSPDFVPGLLTTEDKLGLLILGLGSGLVGGGLLEELGWTGFAVPSLRRRHGVLTTGLIVGLLWGTWHLLIAFWASRGLAGEASLGEFVAGFLAFYFVALPAYRVLMVWLYDRTASLLLAMLMHAVLSASTIILQPLSERGHFTWNFLLGAALWAVVAMIAAVRRGELAGPSVPPAAALRARAES